VIPLFAACERAEPIAIDEYTARLAYVLEEQAPETRESARLVYPRVRELQIQLDAMQINLLEFLSLGDCELQAVIAEGNSSLGRLAMPSRRMIYELDFLRTVETCFDAGVEDVSLARTLRQARQVKEQQLPARIWLTTLGGEEFRHFWIGTAVPPDGESQLGLNALAAQISSWLDGERVVEDELLEMWLRKIDQRDAGWLLHRWRYIADHLPGATAVLADRFARKPLCYPDMKTDQAEIFRTVIFDGFINGIQREVAVLSRLTYDTMRPIHEMETYFYNVETAAYKTWRIGRDRLIANGRQAVQDHVDALTPLMRQCGFLPKTNPEEHQ
jgi:hypothetical protein